MAETLRDHNTKVAFKRFIGVLDSEDDEDFATKHGKILFPGLSKTLLPVKSMSLP